MKAIGVFCGGFSSEFDISLKSTATILEHFPEGYNPIKIIVSRDKFTTTWEDKSGIFDLNTAHVVMEGIKIPLDAALVFTHGDPGENGKLQAYLAMFNIPCINADFLASALSFDKWYCNQFLKSFDIPVAKSLHYLKGMDLDVSKVESVLGFPVFVKPSNSGSSFGITKVHDIRNLNEAFALAFTESSSVVIESFLSGTEVTCGVYRSESGLEALPLTEIVSENEYFDFEAKYHGKSQEITPARISDSSTLAVQEMAKRVYALLNLRSIARIDFMLVGDTPYVIEVNTTPGFSSESIVPKMLQAAGIPIRDFWKTIFGVELQRS